jgi:hypothetical protein
VVVFEPPLCGSGHIKVKVTLRLAVYRRSVRLGVKPLENHDQRLFLIEPLQSWSLCNTLSDEMIGLSLIYKLGL